MCTQRSVRGKELKSSSSPMVAVLGVVLVIAGLSVGDISGFDEYRDSEDSRGYRLDGSGNEGRLEVL